MPWLREAEGESPTAVWKSHEAAVRPLVGFLVALEGIEGSGKSTIARRLAARFRTSGTAVTLSREPGGTAIGERIRGVLLDTSAADIAAETEALLFAASRAQLIAEIVRPALARGDVVIVDRFTDSSLAYQWGGRGLPLEAVKAVQVLATRGLEPDIKLLFDAPVAVGLERRFAAADQANRLDRETHAFHERVREAYRTLASADSERWCVIDATRTENEVWLEVCRAMVGMGFAEFGSPDESERQLHGNES